MSYLTQADMSTDMHMRKRIAACAATQDIGGTHELTWTDQHQWRICGSPGWDAAWASALAAENPQPGKDEGVITDGMILAAVQAVLPE